MKHRQEGLITHVRYVPLGTGKICEVKVDVGGRPTPWLEVRTRVTNFYKEFTPPAVNDQAIVHNPNGTDNENAYVEIGVAYESVVLPKIIHGNMIYREEGSTVYINNLQKKEITLTTKSAVSVTTSNEIYLKASKVTIDAEVEITKNLNVLKKINDVKGSLTDHKHAVQNHKLALPR